MGTSDSESTRPTSSVSSVSDWTPTAYRFVGYSPLREYRSRSECHFQAEQWLRAHGWPRLVGFRCTCLIRICRETVRTTAGSLAISMVETATLDCDRKSC